MHAAATTPSPFPPARDPSSQTISSCPVKSPNHPIRSPSSLCPSSAENCQARTSTISKLNPLNYMPSLSNKREHAEQTVSLPLSRETSSIPRGDADANWEYPSPQQMYNAMLRKGYNDTPADAVEAMVAVHNFLNEGAWAEILEWERRFGGGPARAWRACARGEAGSVHVPGEGGGGGGAEAAGAEPDRPAPQLARLMGRPGDLTPKARLLQAA